MSNCINIVKGTYVVRFSSDIIDVGKVREYLKRAEESDNAASGLAFGGSPQDCNEFKTFSNNLWWFFSHRNISIDAMGVVVRFGEGESSHTWRDFRWVLDCVIKPIMKGSKVHVFTTEDEYDGFKSQISWKHDFQCEMS